MLGQNTYRKNPVVSIVIPTFNRLELLKETVNSALSQKVFFSYEVIVVNNSADSRQNELLNKYLCNLKALNLTLYRNEKNLGMFGNWNRCLELAKGEWVTILNDDDLLDSNYLSKIMSNLSNKSDIFGLCCKVRKLDNRNTKVNIPVSRQAVKWFRGKVERDKKNKIIQLNPTDYFLSNPHYGSLGILLNRQKALELGGFYESLFPISDYVFFTRFSLKFNMYQLNETLVSYRVHENENIKEETMIKSIQLAFKFRDELSKYTRIPLFLSKLYSNLYAINSPKSLIMGFGATCNVTEILYKAGFKNRPVYVQLNILYLLIKLFIPKGQ